VDDRPVLLRPITNQISNASEQRAMLGRTTSRGCGRFLSTWQFMLAVKWIANVLIVLTAAMRVKGITVVTVLNVVQEHFKPHRRI
jgi:hypothetical protein